MSRRGSLLRRVRHWIANRGWRGFLEELYCRARLIVRGEPLPGREIGRTELHPFDRAYNVDTAGLVWGEALVTRPGQQGSDSHYWATGYYGIGPSAFTSALDYLNLPWQQFTFVDVGCGKGRALLLASRFPFRRLLGVELSPVLAAAAQENLRRFAAPWRRANVPAEAIADDATTFAIPGGPLLLFLYHPFAAPVMRRFVAHLQAAAVTEQREIVVLYANPELASMLEATPGFEALWRYTFALSTEDSAADRFGSQTETFAAFQVRPVRT